MAEKCPICRFKDQSNQFIWRIKKVLEQQTTVVLLMARALGNRGLPERPYSILGDLS